MSVITEVDVVLCPICVAHTGVYQSSFWEASKWCEKHDEAPVDRQCRDFQFFEK